MKFRKLRIAWSVAWGVGAVLLIAMWVRSFETWDRCYWPGGTLGMQLNSDADHIVLVVFPRDPSSNIVSFFAASRPTYDESQTYYKDDVLGFYFRRTPSGFRLDVPHWFLALLSVSMAAAPWRRQLDWRFSLRTLLIATTLVAVGLGLIMYVVRS